MASIHVPDSVTGFKAGDTYTITVDGIDVVVKAIEFWGDHSDPEFIMTVNIEGIEVMQDLISEAPDVKACQEFLYESILTLWKSKQIGLVRI